MPILVYIFQSQVACTGLLVAGKKAQHKRNHHILPKLYLKGFTEKKGEPFIWVYTRKKPYNPGLTRHKYNPFRDSINYAGAERDYYSHMTKDGIMDFDTYENILEKLEKPADPVFEKIRTQNMVTAEEKEVLASYIMIMVRRVPRRKEKAEKIWPEFIESFRSSSEIIQWINSELEKADPTDTDKLSKFSKLREEVEQILDEYKDNIPPKILLDSMVMRSRLVPILCDMVWQFLVAPEGKFFITGDNPVFYFESFGLNKPYSELTFPISSDVVLALSWHKEFKEGFLPATNASVKELNRRTSSMASHYVYSPRKAKWIVDVLNKKDHQFNLLYAYSGPLE